MPPLSRGQPRQCARGTRREEVGKREGEEANKVSKGTEREGEEGAR